MAYLVYQYDEYGLPHSLPVKVGDTGDLNRAM
jgi:hypothetical protein